MFCKAPFVFFVLTALALTFDGAPVRADGPPSEARSPDTLLAGTKRVRTIADIPKPFVDAVRREYEASPALHEETRFEPFLANRYFWAMESMELGTGAYILPNPGNKWAKPMCSDGGCDAPLDPSVWRGAWTGGNSSDIADSALPIATWTPGLVPNDNSIPSQNCSNATNGMFDHAAQAHQSIVPSGWDPEFPAQLMTVAPAPTSNPASLRLGNRCNGFGGERVAKTFPVVPGQTTLQFWYAMVFQNPFGHPPSSQPGFGAWLYSGTSPVTNRLDLDPVAPGFQEFVRADATNPFFGSKVAGGSTVVFSSWTCVTVDLSGLEGQTLTLILVNRDCGYGGHWGYTYVDSFCMGCAGSATGDVTFNAAASDCTQGQLCFDYTVPVAPSGATGTVDLSLDLYQSGALVTTLTSGSLAADGTHCFALPLSSLNPSLGGYDWRATASFALGSTTIAPIGIGSAPYGQSATPGANDDCRFPVVDPCDALVREGHAEGCCGYHITLNPGGSEIQAVKYSVATGGATVQSLWATPCAYATSPGNPSGTTSGVLTFNPPCAQGLALDIVASDLSGSGTVCIDLLILIGKKGAEQECRTQICFPCCTPPPCPGVLCVYKFNDANGDGVQQIGEVGIPGVAFVVSGNAQTVSIGTNASGVFPAGNYTVVEVSQPGYTATTPTTQTTAVRPGRQTDVTFGNRKGGDDGERTGKLCVRKFYDANGNGRPDPGEPPLGSFTFQVKDASGVVVGTLTTDATGVACGAFPVGTYLVVEVAQAGYTPTTPATQAVAVQPGTTTNAVFGNAKTKGRNQPR